MIKIILIAVIPFLIFGIYKFLKGDKKELTAGEASVPELDLPSESWDLTQIPEPIKVVKEVKAISKTKKATETKATEPKKKGRPKKSK